MPLHYHVAQSFEGLATFAETWSYERRHAGDSVFLLCSSDSEFKGVRGFWSPEVDTDLRKMLHECYASNMSLVLDFPDLSASELVSLVRELQQANPEGSLLVLSSQRASEVTRRSSHTLGPSGHSWSSMWEYFDEITTSLQDSIGRFVVQGLKSRTGVRTDLSYTGSLTGYRVAQREKVNPKYRSYFNRPGAHVWAHVEASSYEDAERFQAQWMDAQSPALGFTTSDPQVALQSLQKGDPVSVSLTMNRGRGEAVELALLQKLREAAIASNSTLLITQYGGCLGYHIREVADIHSVNYGSQRDGMILRAYAVKHYDAARVGGLDSYEFRGSPFDFWVSTMPSAAEQEAIRAFQTHPELREASIVNRYGEGELSHDDILALASDLQVVEDLSEAKALETPAVTPAVTIGGTIGGTIAGAAAATIASRFAEAFLPGTGTLALAVTEQGQNLMLSDAVTEILK